MKNGNSEPPRGLPRGGSQSKTPQLSYFRGANPIIIFRSMKTHFEYAPIICNMGLMNQHLIAKSLDFGLIQEAKSLQVIDHQLMALLQYKATRFDFVKAIANGTSLLVGEGNLSFTQSLTRKTRIVPSRLTATTFENANALAPSTFNRAEKLKTLGVNIVHGVDAKPRTHESAKGGGEMLFSRIECGNDFRLVCQHKVWALLMLLLRDLIQAIE